MNAVKLSLIQSTPGWLCRAKGCTV